LIFPRWLRPGSLLKSAELIFFPSFCHLCSSLLEFPGEKIVCRECLDKLIPHRASYCVCCGKFFAAQGAPHFCAECLQSNPPYSRHRSCGCYQNTLKDLILLYKYRKLKVLSVPLAEFILKKLNQEEDLWWGVEVLIPVPLHPNREKERGFNQAELLAAAIADKKDLPLMTGVLIKTKNTLPQTSLAASERFRNAAGMYKVAEPEKIVGKIVLLVDDVYTTGATVRECSRILLGAGAKDVRALTLAQA